MIADPVMITARTPMQLGMLNLSMLDGCFVARLASIKAKDHPLLLARNMPSLRKPLLASVGL
jgi:hypothetical protein